MAGGSRAGRSIDYIKPAEPSFLKKFKEQVGYKEGPTVDTKRKVPSLDELPDRPEEDDEQPVVVVLRDGDLTQEEADGLLQTATPDSKADDASSLPVPDNGKIVFKKPTKRSTASDLNTTSSKKKKHSKEKRKGNSKKVNNSSLLSFGDDEEV